MKVNVNTYEGMLGHLVSRMKCQHRVFVVYTTKFSLTSFYALAPELGRLTHVSVICSLGTAWYDSKDHL